MKIDARYGRPLLINSKFPAIIIPEHRAKTPRTKKKKNLVPKLPKTPFPPPHSDESLSFARQRSDFFDFTLPSVGGVGASRGRVAGGSRAGRGGGGGSVAAEEEGEEGERRAEF